MVVLLTGDELEEVREEDAAPLVCTLLHLLQAHKACGLGLLVRGARLLALRCARLLARLLIGLALRRPRRLLKGGALLLALRWSRRSSRLSSLGYKRPFSLLGRLRKPQPQHHHSDLRVTTVPPH